MTKTFYINTMGCQMNVCDTNRMAAALTRLGYTATDNPAEAGLVIVNTCTIRAKARQKAVSFIGRLGREKRKRPSLIVAVGGCVAQHEGRALLEAFPQVDIVFGTHAVERLPEHIRAVAASRETSPAADKPRKRTRVVDVELSSVITEGDFAAGRGQGKISDFVTIMRGCDNFCTYCVVPYVRGRETSRPPEHIIREIKDLVADGVREVTLLGQNVNSYGNKEGHCSFPELLAMVNRIENLARLRFTTSHPKDLSPELIDSFRNLDRLCSHFHLPVQSGSDRILKSMNRRYTAGEYLDKLDRLRRARPDMSVTTDLMVGFPGETAADFERTLDLMERARFDSVFAFRYSDRPLAPASALNDKIPEEERARRLNVLLERQQGISLEKNVALVGTIQEVLVEGPSKRPGLSTESSDCERTQWTGRTTTNKVVNFIPEEKGSRTGDIVPGSLVQVEIDHGFAHSLVGRVVAIERRDERQRGKAYVAQS